MTVEDSVAQDQLRAFVERIERMEEEKAAIAADIKEIYAEAKGNGFDTKILRKLVTIRKQDANERMEQDSILELYMGALGMVAAPPEDDYEPVRQPATLSNSEATLDALIERLSGEIDPKLLMQIIEGSKTVDGRQAILSALDAVKAESITEPQPALQAESDLTRSHAPENGQVADNSDIANPISNEKAEAAELTYSDPQRSVPATREDAPLVASAPMYAEPGVITWESCPPEPVERHEYSAAFGDLGQDIEVITEDMQQARSAPIVKVKNKILDGWARYMKARELGIEYPVVQYDGTDWLVDCIKWNIEGRILTDQQKRTISNRLIAIFPQRKGIIWAAMAGEEIG
jgi:uncharacterized protein (UPF0335 family)